MKTIKLLFAIIPVIILCPFIWSWSVIPGTQTTVQSIAFNSTTPRQVVKKTSQLRIDFWRLVHSGDTRKEAYDILIKKYGYQKLTVEEKNILSYLKKICKDSESFLRYIKIPNRDRQNAKSLIDISID